MSHQNVSFGLVGIVSVVALVACTDETVNLGGGRVSQQIQRGARCEDSTIIAESVRVTNQAELQALAGCERIDGDLRIQVFEGADLRPLAALRTIGGMLELGALPDLSGGIESTKVELSATEREQILADGYLPSLTGLDALERVAGLKFSEIAAEDLEPLLSVRELAGRGSDVPTGTLSLIGTRLRSLSGLQNAEGVVDLAIVDNPELDSLAGLVLDESPRNVAVMASPKITALPELSSMVFIYSLNLFDLGIADLDDLENLFSVESSLGLFGNRNLVNVDRLANISAGQLQIEDNPVLESIPPLGEMTWLESFIAVDNPELKAINLELPVHGSGPDVVQSELVIDPIKVIDIGRNEKLASVSLTAGLEEGRFLAIYENASLTSVSLGTLTRLEELRVQENPNLTSIELGALQTAQSVSVIANPSLDTTGLAALRTFEMRFED